jgi:26S proteasome regulatory subunit N12
LLQYHFSRNLAPSPRMYPLIGLSLLRHLVQHEFSQFHLLLERLLTYSSPSPSVSALNDPYIKGPRILEQCIMEGNFLKAWQACATAPGDEYKFFMQLMMSSIR